MTLARPVPHPPQLNPALAGLVDQIDGLRELGAMFWQRGWSVGTSSNYSVVLNREPLELLVTASGKDKGRLTRGDFVRVGANGKPTVDGPAEVVGRNAAARRRRQQPGVGAVLHTHSVWSTLLSDLYHSQGGFEISRLRNAQGARRRRHARTFGLGRDFRQHARHSRPGRAGPRAPDRRRPIR